MSMQQMRLNRRNLLIGGASASAVWAGQQRHWPLPVMAQTGGQVTSEMLVVVFLRGGCDGLNLVGPVRDRNYQAARPSHLRIAESGDQAGLMLDNPIGDTEFRLHANAAGLKTLYDQKALAIVHACGLTNGTRSHFDAESLIERGLKDDNTQIKTGWLSRYLATTQRQSPFSVVATSDSLPRSLLGDGDAIAIKNVNEFNLWGDERMNTTLKQIYADTALGSIPLSTSGLTTFGALDIVQQNLSKDAEGSPVAYQPENGAVYLEYDELSDGLKTVAQLIKMELGLQIATVDYGGWDTHENQSNRFPTLVENLSKSLHAFYNDVSAYHNRLTVVVMSEFGRRLKANESHGTDHGYGNVMMVLGGQVDGGKMYGQWPGLANEALDQGADLAITTDYRSVLGEILTKRLGSTNLETVFPNFSQNSSLNILL
jgi:uncharacterized protein (DUF1501 family)